MPCVYGNGQADDDDISSLDYESDYAPYLDDEYSPGALSVNSSSRVCPLWPHFASRSLLLSLCNVLMFILCYSCHRLGGSTRSRL